MRASSRISMRTAGSCPTRRWRCTSISIVCTSSKPASKGRSSRRLPWPPEPRMKPHVLENDVWQIGLLPETGMSTAFGRIKHGGAWLDFMRPTAEASYRYPSDCASFLLVPWSNRLRDARFRFRGKTYQLASNMRDGTAIHGVGREHPWAVERADGRQLAASFDSRAHENIAFPFAFTA